MLEKSFVNIIVNLFGVNSKVYNAYLLVKNTMNKENGFIRKVDQSDYYTHCINVAYFLLMVNVTDENVIAAALLHDMIEDVDGYDHARIKHLFNERIADLVDMLSKKDDVNYKEASNLQSYLDNISLDLDAAIIKIADRLHNMRTLGNKKSYLMRKAIETETFFMPLIEKTIESCDNNYYTIFLHYAHHNISSIIEEIKIATEM